MLSTPFFVQEDKPSQSLLMLLAHIDNATEHAPLPCITVCKTGLNDKQLKTVIDKINQKPFLMASIQDLNLSDNVLTAVGAQYLAEHALKKWPKLQNLDLNNNPLGSRGLKEIQQALSHKNFGNTSVISLKINNIGCGGHEGSAIIADLIKDNISLKSLEIASNQLSDDIALVADALRENQKLEILDCRGNLVGNRGALAFAQSLSSSAKTSSTSLVKTHYSFTDYFRAVLDEILGKLPSNTTLQKLYISSNNIGAEGLKALSETAIEVNCSEPSITPQLRSRSLGDLSSLKQQQPATASLEVPTLPSPSPVLMQYNRQYNHSLEENPITCERGLSAYLSSHL